MTLADDPLGEKMAACDGNRCLPVNWAERPPGSDFDTISSNMGSWLSFCFFVPNHASCEQILEQIIENWPFLQKIRKLTLFAKIIKNSPILQKYLKITKFDQK